MTTDDVDRIVHDYLISHNAYPTPLGYGGFPKSISTCVNEVLSNGIPDLRPLVNGDYLNIDCSLYIDGVHGDSGLMVKIGDIHPDVQKLIETT